MKITSAHTQNVWKSGDYAGPTRRPTVRATISRLTTRRLTYRMGEEKVADWAHQGYLASTMFGQTHQPRELHNIQSIRWQRGVETDVATCSIVLANVQVRNSEQPHSDAELDFPGFFTPHRGTDRYFDRWGYVSNSWKNWLLPDRVIRTFEGYGIDPDVAPEKDPYLYPSGVWLIDDVVLDAQGTITLECRDFGRLLLDQVIYPTAVPFSVYPLSFEPFEGRAQQFRTERPAGGSWSPLQYHSDSNLRYRGRNVRDDDGSPVVSVDGSVFGHHGRDAFDAKTSTFWLSVGHREKKRPDAVAWLQAKLPKPGPVEGVRVRNGRTASARAYISVQRANGTWIGNRRVPYRKRGRVSLGANIPYVAEFKLRGAETAEIRLPRRYTNIKNIRVTLTHMGWGPAGYNLNYRGAIAEVDYAPTMTTAMVTRPHRLGNYGDYTTVVKWLLGWAGWYWPGERNGLPDNKLSDGTTVHNVPASVDNAMHGEGRIWGDMELTGTKGIAPLNVDVFDRRPFMDGIAAVREVVGFDFWIDETGGAIWRMPNIFKRGNYVMPELGGPRRAARSTNLIEIDERETLTTAQVKLSSKNVRERVLVADTSGKNAAVVPGYMPETTGLRRIAGWTDQKFASASECERMADLIALRQAFLYRQSSVTISANPAIQPDDQVIITERTTGEGNIHRVLSISSEWSAETGQWTYQLTTNWLANRTFTRLAFNPKKLRNITRMYLRQLRRL